MKRSPVLVLAVLTASSLAGCAGVGDPVMLEAPESVKQDALDVQLAVTSAEVDWQVDLHNGTPLRSVEVHAFPLPFSPGGGDVVWNATDPSASGSVILELTPGTWYLRVRVEDQTGREAWSSQEILTVAAPIPGPLLEVDAGPDQQRHDSDGDGQQSFQVSGTALAGPGQEILGYAWLEDGARISSSPTTTFTRPAGENVLTFEVTYRDAQGLQGVATDDVRVTIVANEAPTADAGPDQTIANTAGHASVSVALDGLASNDTDGAIQSYQWSLDGQSLLTTATGTVSVPADAENVVTHTITLTVTDNGGATDTDNLTLKVNPPGIPIARAGADITVIDEDDDGSETVTLDGSDSFDPDDTITSFSWTDGSGAVVATTAQVSLTLGVGVHTFDLTVQNAAGRSDTDEVKVTVRELPPAPVAAFTHDCTGFTCSFDASDSTGEALVFHWTFGDGGQATGKTVTHAFPALDAYPVELTVEDVIGRTAVVEADVDTRPDLPLTISSPAFGEGEEIPYRYGCRFGVDPFLYFVVPPSLLGLGISPPLSFTAPPGTQSLALTVVDMDPDIAHWVVWNIPVPASGVVEIPAGSLPQGSVEGQEEFAGNTGYLPVCGFPGTGDHTFQFTVYALSKEIGLRGGSTRGELLEAISDIKIAEATTTGTYANRVCDPADQICVVLP